MLLAKIRTFFVDTFLRSGLGEMIQECFFDIELLLIVTIHMTFILLLRHLSSDSLLTA